jgi:CHAT domain-containing protein
MSFRRPLKLIGLLTGSCVLALVAFVLWDPSHGVHRRHPNSNDPRELLQDADYLFWLNNSLEAQPFYARAERLFESKGDRRNALYARVSQIPAETESRNLAELSQDLTQELREPSLQHDPYLRLRLLVVKGEVDLDLDTLSARPIWQEVQTLSTSLGEYSLASRASGELGILAFLDGKGEEAKSRVGKALLYAKVVKDVGAEIRYLAMIGQGLVEVGRSEDGLKYLDAALQKAAKNPDVGFPKLAVIGRVSALTALGRYEEARSLLRRGLEYAKTRQLHGYQIDVLAQFGLIAARTGDLPGAIRYYDEAAEMATQLHFLRGSAEVEARLAEVHQRMGNLEMARSCAEASAAAHRALGEIYEVPHHLAIQAKILARMGQLGASERLYAKATDITEAMLLNDPGLTVRRVVIAAMSEVYLGSFELAADGMKDLDKAFNVIEHARGRNVADAFRAHSAGVAGVHRDAAEGRIASLNNRLLDSENAAERARLLDAIFEAEQDLSPDDWIHARETPVPLRTLQADLGTQEVLLEYVLDEPSSFCLAITRRRISLSKLAGRDQINKLVAGYRNAIANRIESRNASEKLWNELLKPISEYGQAHEVLVVPDGVLSSIPFDGLWSDSVGYAMNDHSFVVVPSGTVLHLLRHQPPRPAKIALLGVSASQVGGTKKLSTSGFGIFRGLLDVKRSSLTALPSTETEVKSIVQLVGHDATLIMRERATEAAFKGQPLGDIRIFHLALHGIADSTFPDRSALVFSSGGRAGEDGLLQAREIRKLPISAELVTLSACDTGLGRIEGEEGTSSLVEAFLDAGARSVVASLWPAEDTYTKSLMEAFYRHLFQGETKKEALHGAKIDMLRQFGETVPPLYWAGFVLVGDGNGTVLTGGSRDVE